MLMMLQDNKCNVDDVIVLQRSIDKSNVNDVKGLQRSIDKC